MKLGLIASAALFLVSALHPADTSRAAKLDPKFAAECAGSYALDKNHIIDIGPMDEMGGDLVFLDSQTLREGHLHQVAESEFVAGPTLGVDAPVAIRITFLRDRRHQIDGIRWDGDGIRNTIAKRIAPHKTESVEVRNGDVVLRMHANRARCGARLLIFHAALRYRHYEFAPFFFGELAFAEFPSLYVSRARS